MSLVCNFFGGPGVGKSSMAAGLFSRLKWKGVNCEIASEYVKGKVWENSLDVLNDQVYILGKQHHAIFRLYDKVDVVITDSPILLSIVYGQGNWGLHFEPLVHNLFRRYRNLNYFLTRNKPYQGAGRIQSYIQAMTLDEKIRETLAEYPYRTIPGDESSLDIIADEIIAHVGRTLP